MWGVAETWSRGFAPSRRGRGGCAMNRGLMMVVAVAATAGTAAAQQHWYMRSNQGQPWGHTSNEDAMNMVFGQGNWTDSPFQNQPAADVFDDESECVFIDGSDFGANALNSYLQA